MSRPCVFALFTLAGCATAPPPTPGFVSLPWGEAGRVNAGAQAGVLTTLPTDQSAIGVAHVETYTSPASSIPIDAYASHAIDGSNVERQAARVGWRTRMEQNKSFGARVWRGGYARRLRAYPRKRARGPDRAGARPRHARRRRDLRRARPWPDGRDCQYDAPGITWTTCWFGDSGFPTVSGALFVGRGVALTASAIIAPAVVYVDTREDLGVTGLGPGTFGFAMAGGGLLGVALTTPSEP